MTRTQSWAYAIIVVLIWVMIVIGNYRLIDLNSRLHEAETRLLVHREFIGKHNGELDFILSKIKGN